MWSREDNCHLENRYVGYRSCSHAQGLTDESFRYHLMSAKKNGITREEIAEIITHAAFYCGWPKPGRCSVWQKKSGAIKNKESLVIRF